MSNYILQGLSKQQQQAAIAPAGPVCIVAGAGTGKTRTVTYRIAQRVHTGQIRSSEVLAITHSRKAASELRDRLAQLGVHGATIRTFHAHALAQLSETRGKDSFSICDGGRKWKAISSSVRNLFGAVEDATLRDIHDEISWAQTQRINPNDYVRLSRARDGIEAAGVKEIYKAYQAFKNNTKTFDFEDLLSIAASDIQTDPDAQAWTQRWKHITVDEYQDIDPLQEHALNAWTSDTVDLCVVGDARQSIYGFKGAEPRYLLDFHKKHPNATVVELTENYRSSDAILESANKVASSYTPLVGASATTGRTPKFHYVDDPNDEVNAVISTLKRYHTEGIPYEEMAVLYRFNSTAARYESALGKAGISIQLAGGDESFWDKKEVKKVLGPFGQYARAEPEINGLSLLKQIAADLGWSEDNPPQGAGAVRERWELVSALIGIAQNAGVELEASELLDALLASHAAAHIPTRGGVSVGSVHKAKGLEFDVVIVVDAVDGSFPSFYAKTTAERTEERNIVYVAITRAKRYLDVFSPRVGARNRKNTPSPLFTRVTEQSALTASRSNSVNIANVLSQVPQNSARSCQECEEKLRGPELGLKIHVGCINSGPLHTKKEAVGKVARMHGANISDHGLARLLTLDTVSMQTVKATPGVTANNAAVSGICEALS